MWYTPRRHSSGAAGVDAGQCFGFGAEIEIELTDTNFFMSRACCIHFRIKVPDAVVPGRRCVRMAGNITLADVGHQLGVAASPVINCLLGIANNRNIGPCSWIIRIATRDAATGAPLQ